jgi:mRNA interferase RelE/StbE
VASYSVRFKPSVEKDLLRLPKDIVSRVWDRIENLKSDPFPHQAGKLSGAEHLPR